MKESFRQSMAWLHTWTGLVVGWVLFFVFVTGTAGYVNEEISRWMAPEKPLPIQLAQVDQDAALAHGLAYLQSHAPGAATWSITLPHQSLAPREVRPLTVSWEEMPLPGHESGRFLSEKLNASTGQPEVDPETRATRGGWGLYRMHYALHYIPYDIAIMLVGICTMLMLMAVITGVITHKKIFSDFFTFRPGKGKRSWLDAHAAISVLCLPFFLMITYTGLMFFMFSYMPAARDAIYGSGDAQRKVFYQQVYDNEDHQHLPLVLPPQPLLSFVQQARQAWGDDQVSGLKLEYEKGEPPLLEVRRVHRDRLAVFDPEVMRFNAQDGTVLPPEQAEHAARQTQSVLLNLHEGRFANWWLRWLYFISGVLGCAVIATGLVMWTVKRRAEHGKKSRKSSFDEKGLRLVEVLNVASIVGLPMGVAAYFLANRLLPVQMADRAAWEMHALFLVWGWTLLYGALRPVKRAWIELLWMAVAVYASVPLINALTSHRHLGVSLANGDWGLAGVDLTMLAFAALFAWAAIKLRRKWLPAVAVSKKAPAPEPEWVEQGGQA